MAKKLLYTVPEVANILGIGVTKVWSLIAMCEIQSVQIGRSRRVTEAALLDFVAALEAEALGEDPA